MTTRYMQAGKKIANILRFLELNPEIKGEELDMCIKEALGSCSYKYTTAFFMAANLNVRCRLSALSEDSFWKTRKKRSQKKLDNMLSYGPVRKHWKIVSQIFNCVISYID